MNCALLDVACHVQGAAWEWWADVGLLNKALIIGGLVLVILAAARSVLALVHKVGGWPAVLGFVMAIVGLVLALLPKHPAPRAVQSTPAGEFKFGTERTRAKPRARTIFDLLRKRGEG